ncbi:MAG: hypothetical protein ACI9XP_001223 [Lentimonas sp.]|jgi:hypothetical protein
MLNLILLLAISTGLVFALRRCLYPHLCYLNITIILSIKITATVLFYMVYSNYYGKGELTEDAGAYYQEAKILKTVFIESPSDYWQIIFASHDKENLITKAFESKPFARFAPNGWANFETRNFIGLCSALLLITPDSPWSLFIVFGTLTLIILLVLISQIKNYTGITTRLCLILVFAPNVLFWSSGLLKESILFIGFALVLMGFVIEKANYKVIAIAMGSTLLLFFKPIIGIMLLVSYLLVLAWRIFIKHKLIAGISYILIIVSLCWSQFPNHILREISDKQYDFVNVGKGGYHFEWEEGFLYAPLSDSSLFQKQDSLFVPKYKTPLVFNSRKKEAKSSVLFVNPTDTLHLAHLLIGGRSYFPLKLIDNKFSNLLISIPESLLNFFFRPFPFDKVHSLQKAILLIENLIIFGLFIFLIIRLFKSQKQESYLLTTIIFVLIAGTVIGLITPVSGALVRYRMPVQLFILFSFLLNFSKNEPNKTID